MSQSRSKIFHFNPFYFIKETNASPHALTLRSSLWEKLKDTFWVLNGSYFFTFLSKYNDDDTQPPWVSRKGNEDKERLNFGVLDLLTLGIPKVLGLIIIGAFLGIKDGKHPKWQNALAGLFLTIFGLPGLLLHGTVVLISLTLMVALSPLVAIVHGFSQIKGTDYKKAALKAVTDNPDNPTPQDYEKLFALEPELTSNIDEDIEIKIGNNSIENKSIKQALMRLNIGNCVGKYEKTNFIIEIDIERVKINERIYEFPDYKL